MFYLLMNRAVSTTARRTSWAERATGPWISLHGFVIEHLWVECLLPRRHGSGALTAGRCCMLSWLGQAYCCYAPIPCRPPVRLLRSDFSNPVRCAVWEQA